MQEDIKNQQNENLKPQKQDDAQASHCEKISKSDGLFSFDEEAGQIYNKFEELREILLKKNEQARC